MSRNASVVGYSIGSLAHSAPQLARDAGLEVLDLLRQGIVRIDITEVIELNELRSTHARIEAGHTHGKLALRITG
jgi:NADPH:quinone reductase-like Zn-dependent oxidoreductase